VSDLNDDLKKIQYQANRVTYQARTSVERLIMARRSGDARRLIRAQEDVWARLHAIRTAAAVILAIIDNQDAQTDQETTR